MRRKCPEANSARITDATKGRKVESFLLSVLDELRNRGRMGRITLAFREREGRVKASPKAILNQIYDRAQRYALSMNATQRLARFALDLNYKRIPTTVIDRAKAC